MTATRVCAQGEFQLPPASLKGSPRSASGSDSDSFQTSASVLNLGAYESLHAPFKKTVCVSYSPLDLPNVSPADFQSQAFYLLIFLVSDFQVGEPDMWLGILASWGGLLKL